MCRRLCHMETSVEPESLKCRPNCWHFKHTLCVVLEHTKWFKELRKQDQGFPGGPVVRSLPASARDAVLIPGPGRSHTPRSSWTCAPQLLSLCSGAREPQLLSPELPLPKPVHPGPVSQRSRALPLATARAELAWQQKPAPPKIK